MKTYSENALQEERKSGAEFHEPAFRVSVTQKILLINETEDDLRVMQKYVSVIGENSFSCENKALKYF